METAYSNKNIKVKLFEENKTTNLEDNINSFLEETMEVYDIKYSSTMVKDNTVKYSAMMIYIDK